MTVVLVVWLDMKRSLLSIIAWSILAFIYQKRTCSGKLLFEERHQVFSHINWNERQLLTTTTTVLWCHLGFLSTFGSWRWWLYGLSVSNDRIMGNRTCWTAAWATLMPGTYMTHNEFSSSRPKTMLLSTSRSYDGVPISHNIRHATSNQNLASTWFNTESWLMEISQAVAICPRSDGL